MKTMGELPPYIRNPGKADGLCEAAAFPGTFTQWGKVPSAGEHYSEPASSISSLSPSGNPISSVTTLGMQAAFHTTACSHPALLMLVSDGGLCPALAPQFPMHSLCSQHAGGEAPCNASCMHAACIPIWCGAVLAVALWRCGAGAKTVALWRKTLIR